MLAANLETSTVIGGSSSMKGLLEHLATCCKDAPKQPFTHIVHLDLDCTVRIYGQGPFAKSHIISSGISIEEIAEELMLLSEADARYPPGRKQGTTEGWTIHRGTDADGNILIAAYASWILRPL